ncbi:hypothetical protein DYBT9623_03544 [Dyadobacter sp. CECT 9623]|uniref:Schlafen AlbA-2 domain-containing protein n=1 Tax=Dyadobacter linearis TaxID=2823330 RepID=A0ABM8UTF1_9BACT|nr:ATP-binding protein [Dyadobacter sp. CECT 9623]CAG5071544.1 hypothetical protein DYBT9623_03544 [Dyadobacter sp. CECT 9623]
MTPSKLAFGKELGLLSYSDIENYFNVEQVEADSLEFKSFSGDAKNQEQTIFEEVCAMLNSDGGMIIWGAPRERSVHGKKEKVTQGELTPIPLDQRVEQDRFYNRIGGEITPLPSGIRFRELEQNGEFIYVIEVDKSVSSPHQFNKRYYPMRMGANIRAAPHHYIEALFKKAKNPVLYGKITDIQLGMQYETVATNFEIEIEISNQTPYLNEENLYFTLSHNMDILGKPEGGILVTGKEHSTIVREDKQMLFVYQARPILFFGDVYKAKVNAMVAHSGSGKTYEFVLVFGGKSSPLIRSEYQLRVEYRQGYARPHDLRRISENVPLV